MLTEVVEQFVLVDPVVGGGPDEGTDRLAPLVVWQADDGDLGDGVVGEQDLFDLLGIDVLATPDDHVLQATFDRAVATVVHGGEIAGVEPAVGVDGLRSAVGHVVVAVHHLVAASDELTGRADRECRSGLGIDDADLHARHRRTDREGLVLDRVVGPRHVEHRRAFGLAVHDRERTAELFFECPHEMFGDE